MDGRSRSGGMGRLATGARKVDVSTQVSQAPHETLGLTPEDLLRMHRTMLTARLIDEASFRQNRMGRAPFVVPVSGHEGCQVGTAWAMRAGRRHLGPLLPRPRRRAGRGDDAVRGLPRRVLEGGRPVLGRPADAEPLGLAAARHHQPLLPDRHAGPARRRHRLRDAVPRTRTPSSGAGSARARRARATGTRG